MNAVIYARYSSSHQREQSIEDQISECLAFAKYENLNVINIYADRAKSGRSDDREEFQRMLSDSASKTFEKVIVWKLDRFGRNRNEMAVNRMKLERNGVSVVSAKENIPDGPEGSIMESVLDGMAEYYSRNLSQNVMRGLRSNADKCLSVGGPQLYGHKIEDGKIVLDPDQAKIVKYMFDSFCDGLTVSEIAQNLTRMGIRTKKNKEFKPQTVRAVLTNRKYMGEYRYMDIVIPDGIPAIVDENTFNRTQDLLAFSGHRHIKRHDNYILSGKVYCGNCGNCYGSESGTSKTGRMFFYYKCDARKYKRKFPDVSCKNKTIRKEMLEDTVIRATVNNILHPDNIPVIVDKIMDIINSGSTMSALPVLRQEKQELDKKIQNLLDTLEKGANSDFLIKRLNDLEQQSRDLTVQIAKEEIKKPLPKRDAVEFALNYYKNNYIDNEHTRIKLINNLVSEVIINDDYCTIHYNIVVDNQNLVQCSSNSEMVNHSIHKLNTIHYLPNGDFLLTVHLKQSTI